MTKTKQVKPTPTSERGVLQRAKVFWRTHTFIIVLSAVFLALTSILILTLFSHQLNPDASSYFTIAQKYAEGDIKHAINGYWGPLLSWLLVPAVWLGINLSVAAKLLTAIIAVLLLCTMYTFFRKRKVTTWVSAFALIATAMLLVEWTVVEAISPDLLIAFLTVLFAVRFSDFLDKPTRAHGIALGAIGAAMYFTKGFGFFLFLGVVGVTAAWQWLKKDSRNIRTVVRRYAAMLLTFAVLVLPFIAIISIKYHAPTINNAGAYNQHVTGPLNRSVQPIEYMGPLPLPNDSAISAWEDPTIFIDLVPGWSPLGSRTELGYFINDIFYYNINQIIHYIYGLGPLICAGIVVMFVGAFQKKNRQKDFVIFAVIAAMMFVAYALVFVVSRYLWAAALLGIMALVLWLDYAVSRKALDVRQVIIGGTLVCAVMGLGIGNYIGDSRDPDIEWYKSAYSLQDIIPNGSKIMSDSFNSSYHACYYLELKCYNVIAPPPAGEQEQYYRLLKDMGIKYYVDYHTRENDEALNAFVDEYFTKVDFHVTERVPITTYKIK